MSASGGHRIPARSVGPDGRRAVRDGGAAEGRGGRATCAPRRAARRAWQHSVRPRAGRGMATKLPLRALGVHQTAVAGVQEGACGRASHVTPYVGPARERVTTRSRDALRLLLACVARPPGPACGVGVHLSGHGGRERLRVQNEPAHRTCLGSSGGDCGVGAGAAGHTSTGATCAISASKRGSSDAQASPL